MKKFAVVTGASQGLGRSFALELASRGRNLILVSLPNEGLPQMAEEIMTKFSIEVNYYETDLAKPSSVYELTDWINANYEVNLLINNAGIGGTGSFYKTSADYIDTLIQLNVRAMSLLVRLLVKNLQQQDEAYILNVASMASFCPMPLKTVYPASKVFVYFFSRSLYYELKKWNIHICVLHPGPMKTNADVTRRIEVQGKLGKMGLIPTEKLAQKSIDKLFRKQQVIVPGLQNKITWVIMKFMPLGIQMRLGYKLTRKELKIENSFA